MKTIIVPILLLLVLFGCSNQREITLIENESAPLLKEFMDLNPKSRIQITDSSEPGQQLLLCVYVINKHNNEPIVDEEIETYHTNNDGEYNPTNPEDESTCKVKWKS
ncbi:hypothetical protein [Ekhidna sp.]|uniref:hypothetical protein n=1 Tax=Ekhidna sp. TaxID=2608089 RepID=UPI003297493C